MDIYQNKLFQFFFLEDQYSDKFKASCGHPSATKELRTIKISQFFILFFYI